MTDGVILITPGKFSNRSFLVDFAQRSEELIDQLFLQNYEAFLIQLQLKMDFQFHGTNVIVDGILDINVKNYLIDDILLVSTGNGDLIFCRMNL